MEALNNQTNLDDLNLNIDSLQGGLECNVDEVISIDLRRMKLNSNFNFSVVLHTNVAHTTRIEY